MVKLDPSNRPSVRHEGGTCTHELCCSLVTTQNICAVQSLRGFLATPTQMPTTLLCKPHARTTLPIAADGKEVTKTTGDQSSYQLQAHFPALASLLCLLQMKVEQTYNRRKKKSVEDLNFDMVLLRRAGHTPMYLFNARTERQFYAPV